MWLSAILYVCVCVLMCVKAYKYMTYKPENFPPGPPRWPLWGSYVFSLMLNWGFPHFSMEYWAKKYGNIFGLYLGNFPTVVCCDYDTVKEVFNRTVFDGKPDLPTSRIRNVVDKQLGIFFTDGAFWHEQRRFSLRHLRDYGFGRRFEKLESLMNDQLNQVVEFMKYPKYSKEEKDIVREDGCILLPDILFPTMINSLMSIFGMEPAMANTERYRYLREVGRATVKLQLGFFAIGTISMTPWIKNIAPEITGYNNLKRSNNILFPFLKSVLEDIRKKQLDDEEVQCFYDMYLKKMKENENNEESTFSEEQLIMLSIDYLFPAASAVAIVFIQILYTLLHHPDVQERLQKEIDEVVGRGRLPTLDDRKDLPYTEATLREVMRKETLVPLGIVHRTLEDTTLRGYSIPKDTLVYTSIYGAHNDKKIWGDPENFRPERFLDSNGLLKKKDFSLPFGAGKRLCAGETFARNSIFLLLAGLFQNFTFKMPPGVPNPKLENKIPGLVTMQKDLCWVRAIPRD